MSGAGKAGPALFARLDPASRRVAFLFLFRLGCLAALALASCLVGVRTPHQGLQFLTLACKFGAVVAGVFGALRRASFARGSLNSWDEALAFLAAHWLAHAAVLLHG